LSEEKQEVKKKVKRDEFGNVEEEKTEVKRETDSYLERPRQDLTQSTESMDVDYSISKANIPSFRKILVPDDGKEISNKALNHAIYISNLSGAEIVILRVIGDVDKLGDTSVKVSQDSSKAMKNNEKDLRRNVEGELVDAMEEKIRKCTQAGSKNKISYQIKTGSTQEEIVKECEQTKYDLIVMATSRLDSWMRSLFSETRKTISNINIPVLIVQ
jgi:nucleotide-binding universal stress UspA family protein